MQDNDEEVKVGWGRWIIDLTGRNIFPELLLAICLSLVAVGLENQMRDNRTDLNKIIENQAAILKEMQRLEDVTTVHEKDMQVLFRLQREQNRLWSIVCHGIAPLQAQYRCDIAEGQNAN